MTDTSAPFRDSLRPPDERVADLLARLTLTEKVAMLHQYAPPIPRLGLASFRTGLEILHGDVPPRPPRRLGPELVRAADFDDWAGATLVDEVPAGGDAVEALRAGSWLCFRNVDLDRPVDRIVAQVAAVGGVPGEIAARLDDPVDGQQAGALVVRPESGPSLWRAEEATVAVAGQRDVYLVFSAPVRVAAFALVSAGR